MVIMSVYCLGQKKDFKDLISPFKKIPGSYSIKGKVLNNFLINNNNLEEVYCFLQNIKFHNCKVGDLLVVFNMYHQKDYISFITVSVNDIDNSDVEITHFETLKINNLERIQDQLRKRFNPILF
jgi:hypothetical protein